MQARHLMTAEVVTVGPDTPVPEIARLLVEHGISAVPVVDSSGAPIGIVSEGDLAGRDEGDRDRRRDWWLDFLAKSEALGADFLASLRKRETTAGDIMSAPVIAVSETASGHEIARLLAAHRIKRVPVIRDGKIVGIVSRADIVRAMASMDLEPAGGSRGTGSLTSWFNNLDKRFEQLSPNSSPAASATDISLSAPDNAKLDAREFQGLVMNFKRRQAQLNDAERRAAAERRRNTEKTLIDEHITNERWRGIVNAAREAAAHGEKEFLLLRFPSSHCRDGGRAINALVMDQNWPTTLRGESAELYLRWEHDLKPRGFRLAARVLDFPGGFPGDVGLFLVWGESGGAPLPAKSEGTATTHQRPADSEDGDSRRSPVLAVRRHANGGARS